MKLYHGSTVPVQKPLLELCRPNNDYGAGFYMTQDNALASEWACKSLSDCGVVSEYRLKLDGLCMLDLDTDPYTVLNWIAVLMANRKVNFNGGADRAATRRFIERYRVDMDAADVVAGCRADDSYFQIARAFTLGLINVQDLERVLKLGGLGRQIVLKSKKAFDAIEFVRASPVETGVWYRRRQRRLMAANEEFRTILASDDGVSGLRFSQIAGGMQ